MSKSKSIHDAQALLEKIRADAKLSEKLEATRSYQQFLGVAKNEGFDLSALTEQEARGVVRGDSGAMGEISDAELAQVAGGVVLAKATSAQTDAQAMASAMGPPTHVW